MFSTDVHRRGTLSGVLVPKLRQAAVGERLRVRELLQLVLRRVFRQGSQHFAHTDAGADRVKGGLLVPTDLGHVVLAVFVAADVVGHRLAAHACLRGQDALLVCFTCASSFLAC